MTRTFTTPRFGTAYDRVIEPLALPGELRSGQAPDLTTIDQFVRGVAVIGRFIASPGLLGIKVRPTGRPVRVTAHFRFDSMSLDWWEERVSADDEPLRGIGAPRLLLVRAQGRTRSAILIIRQAADAGRPTTGAVSFDLRPEELTEHGLFVLEVASMDRGRPEWAPAVVSGSIGILVDSVEFTEADGALEIGRVSTGTLPVDPQAETMTVRGGYFVANPDDSAEPPRWVARATVVEPLVPGPRTKVEPVVEPVETVEPVSEPIPDRKKTPGVGRKVKRRIRRAARWVVPVAAVPVAKRMSRRAAALERRMRRAATKRLSARSATPPPPPPPPPPVVPETPAPPPGPPPNPLADVMHDLVSRKLVQVELAGVEAGPVPGVQVRARAGAEIEIVTDGPLTVPVLVRLSVDPAVLREVPGVEGGTVRWDLVVTPDS